MAKARSPNSEEKKHWQKVGELPCIVCGAYEKSIHHALTGAGGRKDHMKVLPLCHYHHQGAEGIHTLSRRVWQQKYGTELELLQKVEELIHG